MRYDVPIYDPYKDPGEGYFHPANEAAQCLIFIRHIYDDIVRRGEIVAGIEDTYGRRLIMKDAVTDLLSMDKHIRRLVGLILSGQTGYHVGDTLTNGLKGLYRDYKSACKRRFPRFTEIRNKVGAHRERLPLAAISDMWGDLETEGILEVLGMAAPLFNHMKDLNVYCWTKTEKNDEGRDTLAFVQPLVFDKTI